MFAPHLVLAQASRVRLVVGQLMEVGNTLAELGRGEVATELCDVEMQLMKLHGYLLDTCEQPVPASYTPEPSQEELPF